MTMPQPPDADTASCPGCTFGWIELEAPLRLVAPCPTHMPTQRARWASGAYRPQPWDWFAEMAEAS